MYKSTKSCLLTLVLSTVICLVALLFVLQIAKDNGIMWLVAAILLIACGTIGGKAARTMSHNNPLMKLISGIIIGVFAVGVLVLVYLVFVVL